MLRPIEPVLRRVTNGSNDVLKVSVSVPAGETVEASEYVAAQLERQGFKAQAPAEAAPEVVEAPAEPEPKKGKKG